MLGIGCHGLTAERSNFGLSLSSQTDNTDIRSSLDARSFCIRALINGMDFGSLIHFIGLIIFYIWLRFAGTGPFGTGSTVFKQTLSPYFSSITKWFIGARNSAVTRTFYIFSLDAYTIINLSILCTRSIIPQSSLLCRYLSALFYILPVKFSRRVSPVGIAEEFGLS